jgi:EAL domain-containing protein (putative c-di-GMP-specific phosphodiesterase class I)/AmiR/NasT family two-component response regulator
MIMENSPIAPPASPCNVALIIDDSIFVRQLLRSALKLCGVRQVTEANDGQEALAYLATTNDLVDVIFCDLDMPTLDGIQFIRSLASFERRPLLVLVSSAAERTLRAAETLARDAGIDVAGVLQKPFKHQDIQAILSSLPPPKAQRQPRAEIVVLAEELAAGIARGEIDLYYQPIVNLKTRALIAVEALARWNHPLHGLLLPGAFIPLAEENNLARSLTEAVLAKAVRQCAEWHRSGLECKVAVNLSPKMLNDRAFPEHLTKIVSEAGVAPNDLILEVTESGMFVDNLLSMEIVTRLDLRGFSISIDDFGTGYSSMQQLQRLPFAELKIDRMFIAGATGNGVNQTVIRTSVELARKLKMSVVAEGVETAADWSLVYAEDCDVAQGYFIARPMPAEAVLAWARNWQTRTDIPDATKRFG